MGFLSKRGAGDWSTLWPPILAACGVGVLLFFPRLGHSIADFSFDHAFHFRPNFSPTNVLVVTMGETAYRDKELNPTLHYPEFSRATHAEFLDKLTKGGAAVVVFDIFSPDPQTNNDALLAAAMTRHGKVIIAAELEQISPEFIGFTTNDATQAYVNLKGCQIAFAEVPQTIVRNFPNELPYYPSIALAAAAAYGKNVRSMPGSQRWVRYYGSDDHDPQKEGRNTLQWIPYEDAYLRAPSFFKDKVVFIGGKPKAQHVEEGPDEFRTPFSRWSGQKMRGVEIHATMFLNLTRDEWLTELARRDQFLLVLLTGIAFGWLFTLVRPVPGLALLFIGAFGFTIAGIALVWTQRVWLNWALVGWIEIPIAWATAAVLFSRKVDIEKESLKKELDSIKSQASRSPAAGAAVQAVNPVAHIEPVPTQDAPIGIKDFKLVKQIGEGAYGQVWLARDLMDVYQAIKIIFRKNFSEQRPFEREFEGVRNFVAISRNHPGCINVRHVGKDEAGGFFYYVMDPADDLVHGPKIDPVEYVPKTLGKMLVDKEYLSVPECADLGIDLSAALAALHGNRLIHRDVKPSNIIFANHKARLADIGLVASVDENRSVAGTEGYMPTDRLGTPLADIFSLGRVLYVAATGCPPTRFPELPTSLGERTDARDLMRLIHIVNKACASCSRTETDGYQSAVQLHDDLVKLRERLSPQRG